MESKTQPDHIMNKREEKELAIIRAAERVFNKFGYQKTTLKDIGAEIGLNKASLYHYFKNKEDIFIAVISYEFTQFRTQIATISTEEPIEQRICHFFENLLTFFIQNPLSRQTMDLDLKLLGQSSVNDVFRIRKTQHDYLKEMLEEAKIKGEIKEIDLNQIVQALNFLFEGVKTMVMSKSILFRQEIDLQEARQYVRQSLSILFHGFLIDKN